MSVVAVLAPLPWKEVSSVVVHSFNGALNGLPESITATTWGEMIFVHSRIHIHRNWKLSHQQRIASKGAYLN